MFVPPGQWEGGRKGCGVLNIGRPGVLCPTMPFYSVSDVFSCMVHVTA